jgi:hypothetical protein
VRIILFLLGNVEAHPSLLSVSGIELDRQVVTPIRQVALRASIRGFKDDYHNVDADVVVLAGETHLYRKVVSKVICSHVIDANRASRS